MFGDYWLRDKKFAETKLRILQVFLNKLDEKEFDDISVVEICKDSEISYKTFFNYFEKKSDLLSYYLQFWSIECQYIMSWFSNLSFEDKVSKIFDLVAENYKNNFKVIKEIVAFLALSRHEIDSKNLTKAEYSIRFPKYEWIEKFSYLRIDDILKPYYEEALSSWEISKKIDSEVLFSMIRSIFFWVILSVKNWDTEKIKMLYREQLSMVWKAIKK